MRWTVGLFPVCSSSNAVVVVHVWVGGPQDDFDEAGLVGRARVVVVHGLLGGLSRDGGEGEGDHREDQEEGDLLEIHT